MSTKHIQQDLPWYHIRRIKLTREYVGGLLAGSGLGGILTIYFVDERVGVDWLHPVELSMIGFVLIAIGSTIVSNAQSRQEADSE